MIFKKTKIPIFDLSKQVMKSKKIKDHFFHHQKLPTPQKFQIDTTFLSSTCFFAREA